MLTIRRANDRGHANHGWLDTHHTFSFADYYDPAHMGFRSLRVINDDTVAGGKGFGSHPHRDMEIISYVLDGALSHEDSTGTGSVIVPGDVQRMSAGTGVVHSERNASADRPVHFLQIWILPNQRVPPSYEQKRFVDEEKRGKLRLIASPDGREGSVTIRADANVYAALLGKGERVAHEVARGRGAWVHVARGTVKVQGESLSEGDGASTNDAGQIGLEGADGLAEVLVFDLGLPGEEESGPRSPGAGPWRAGADQEDRSLGTGGIWARRLPVATPCVSRCRRRAEPRPCVWDWFRGRLSIVHGISA